MIQELIKTSLCVKQIEMEIVTGNIIYLISKSLRSPYDNTYYPELEDTDNYPSEKLRRMEIIM